MSPDETPVYLPAYGRVAALQLVRSLCGDDLNIVHGRLAVDLRIQLNLGSSEFGGKAAFKCPGDSGPGVRRVFLCRL